METITKVQSGNVEYDDSYYDHVGFGESNMGSPFLNFFSTPKFYKSSYNARMEIADQVLHEYKKDPTEKEFESTNFGCVALNDWIFGNDTEKDLLTALHEHILKVNNTRLTIDKLEQHKYEIAQLAIELKMVKLESFGTNLKFEDE